MVQWQDSTEPITGQIYHAKFRFPAAHAISSYADRIGATFGYVYFTTTLTIFPAT
jgi:hypothetical protein